MRRLRDVGGHVAPIGTKGRLLFVEQLLHLVLREGKRVTHLVEDEVLAFFLLRLFTISALDGGGVVLVTVAALSWLLLLTLSTLV